MAKGNIKYDRALVEKARKMHESGISIRKIGAALGVNHNTIFDWVAWRSRRFD
jgi:transposase-like protein